MDQIQRWTYDFATKFAKVDPKDAQKMKQKLIKECGLTDEEAEEKGSKLDYKKSNPISFICLNLIQTSNPTKIF